ncbi:MAG: hypothetical protein RIF46_15165 [Cyclobacteriaceae bacterium]
MLEKEKVIETVSKMSDNFHLDELVERLIFIQKVEEGLKAVEEGKTMTTEELREEMK